MKILLLEDEMMLNNSIKEYLEDIGYSVDSFLDGKDALVSISKMQDRYDLFILDINVPSLNGFDFLAQAKEQNIYTPTIFISAAVDIDEITRAFTLGANDYIKKPFHLKELGLRINQVRAQNIVLTKSHVVLSSNYTYSKDNATLFFQKRPCKLTKRQLQIIDILSKNIDSIVGFDQFRAYVYNHEPIDNATIRAEVGRLRKSLKDDIIINVKGIGYKINKYYDI
jgi:DNA-binding response OmpR family regulator